MSKLLSCIREGARVAVARDRDPEAGRHQALARIAQLRGVTWRWRENAPLTARAQPGMGVIAQEVERVFPELVKTDRLGRKKVIYHGLIGPLIEAVKELDERVEYLEGRLEALQRSSEPPRAHRDPTSSRRRAAGLALW